MRLPENGRRPTKIPEKTRERGSARTVVLLLIAFLLGAGLSYQLSRRPAQPGGPGQAQAELTPASRAVVARLEQPVEIRFYSLLDPQSDARLRALSGHVDRLLATYAQDAAGKIRLAEQTNVNPNTAIADGIKGFNLDKGEGCYLGIAFACGGKKEVLAQLSPEWESALEADISRTIERVGGSDARGQIPTQPAPKDTVLIEQLQKDIPNLGTMSEEDAIRAVRAKSLEEFTATVSKMNALVQQATDELGKTQQQGSAAEQQAALKKLQEAQSAQTEALKEVAANSELRIQAVKRLKAGK